MRTRTRGSTFKKYRKGKRYSRKMGGSGRNPRMDLDRSSSGDTSDSEGVSDAPEMEHDDSDDSVVDLSLGSLALSDNYDADSEASLGDRSRSSSEASLGDSYRSSSGDSLEANLGDRSRSSSEDDSGYRKRKASDDIQGDISKRTRRGGKKSRNNKQSRKNKKSRKRRQIGTSRGIRAAEVMKLMR